MRSAGAVESAGNPSGSGSGGGAMSEPGRRRAHQTIAAAATPTKPTAAGTGTSNVPTRMERTTRPPNSSAMVIGPSDRPDHDQAGSGSGARRSGRLRSRVSAWMTNNTRTVMAVTHAAAGMPGHAKAAVRIPNSTAGTPARTGEDIRRARLAATSPAVAGDVVLRGVVADMASFHGVCSHRVYRRLQCDIRRGRMSWAGGLWAVGAGR